MVHSLMVLPMVTRISRALLNISGYFPISEHVRHVRLPNSGCDACSEIVQYRIASARIARFQGRRLQMFHAP